MKTGQAAHIGIKRSDETNQGLAGTLVHRLFERHGISAVMSGSRPTTAITEELRRLIRDEECADVEDLDALLARARDAYLALCGDPTLASALNAGDALFEVPFSVRPSNAQFILRGTFDCLIRRTDGGITVLELKTGTPVPEHQEQLATYLTAARALFPGAAVEGTLVYARRTDLDDRPLN
jgi:ATP-dependent exoDNAse (exonuclease V) beta subunit